MAEKNKKFTQNIFVVSAVTLILLRVGFVLMGIFLFTAVPLFFDLASPFNSMWLNVAEFCSFGLLLAVFLLYIRFTDRKVLSTLGLKHENNSIKTALIGYGIGMLMNVVLMLPAALFGKMTVRFSSVHLLPLLALIFSGFLQSATEEVICRGFVYQYLKPRYGWIVAAVTGSLLFTLAHLNNLISYGINWVFICNVTLVGLVFVLLMRRSGSIWLVFGVHAGWNFTQQYLLGMPNSGNPSAGSVFVSAAEQDSLFFHAAYGPEGTFACTVWLMLILVGLFLWEKKCPNESLDRF